MTLAHHAALNRELDQAEARLHAFDSPTPDPHGDDADQRTARQNAEDVVTERARLEAHLRLILCALTKIERGTFGLCEACRRPIGAKRLAAMPWATLCVRCATTAEIRQERVRQAAQRPAPPEPRDEGQA